MQKTFDFAEVKKLNTEKDSSFVEKLISTNEESSHMDDIASFLSNVPRYTNPLINRPKLDINLRPYQEECISAIPESGSYLIQMAVGLGKTVAFSRIPRKGRMLILSHREELVYQPMKYFDCSYGVEKAEISSKGEEIVSASVQSIVRRLNKFKPDEFDIIITDEAHHAVAPTYLKIYEHFKPRLHLGFTATPNRADDIALGSVFSEIIFERDLQWGIKNGYLSDINCLRVDIGVDIKNVKNRMGDYATNELEAVVNIAEANKAVAEAYAKYAKGQTLIFACSVAHAISLAKEIPGAVAVIGGEDRTQKVEDFKNGKIKVLTNCLVFTEGTDIPNIETIMVARPTKNISLYTQMIGRGTRLFEGKPHLTLIDCTGNDIKMCSAPSLLGLDIGSVEYPEKIEGKLFELHKVIEEQTNSPEYWIKNVQYVSLWAKNKKYNLHNVNYYKMPNGTMILTKPKIIIPPEDSLGRIMCQGERMPAQKVFDIIHDLLKKNHMNDRQLWDLDIVNRWGNAPATAEQKKYAISLCKKLNFKQKVKDDFFDRLSKSQISQVITKCLSTGTSVH